MILLIAANRQDAIPAALSRHDYDTNSAAKSDFDTVLESKNRQLEMITELRETLRRLDPGEVNNPGEVNRLDRDREELV